MTQVGPYWFWGQKVKAILEKLEFVTVQGICPFMTGLVDFYVLFGFRMQTSLQWILTLIRQWVHPRESQAR